MHEIGKHEQKLVEELESLDLMEEIIRCREEMGGPFFNKKENLSLKQ